MPFHFIMPAASVSLELNLFRFFDVLNAAAERQRLAFFRDNAGPRFGENYFWTAGLLGGLRFAFDEVMVDGILFSPFSPLPLFTDIVENNARSQLFFFFFFFFFGIS